MIGWQHNYFGGSNNIFARCTFRGTVELKFVSYFESFIEYVKQKKALKIFLLQFCSDLVS